MDTVTSIVCVVTNKDNTEQLRMQTPSAAVSVLIHQITDRRAASRPVNAADACTQGFRLAWLRNLGIPSKQVAPIQNPGHTHALMKKSLTVPGTCTSTQQRCQALASHLPAAVLFRSTWTVLVGAGCAAGTPQRHKTGGGGQEDKTGQEDMQKTFTQKCKRNMGQLRNNASAK